MPQASDDVPGNANCEIPRFWTMESVVLTFDRGILATNSTF